MYTIENITEPQTVSVQLTPDASHTVVFLSQGQTYAAIPVDHGSLVTLPPAPVVEGFAFAGWYAGGAAFDPSALVTEDLTLTAQFTPLRYTITWPQGGTGWVFDQERPQTVSHGQAVQFTVIVIPGYLPESLTVGANGYALFPVQEGSTLSYTLPSVTADTVITVSDPAAQTLWLHYSANTTDVVDGMPSSGQIPYQGGSLSPAVPARAGYTFCGWSTTADGTAPQYQPGQWITICSDTTLYALWAAADNPVELRAPAAAYEDAQVTLTAVLAQPCAGKMLFYRGSELLGAVEVTANTAALTVKTGAYSASGEQYRAEFLPASGSGFTASQSNTATVALWSRSLVWAQGDGLTSAQLEVGTPVTLTLPAVQAMDAPDAAQYEVLWEQFDGENWVLMEHSGSSICLTPPTAKAQYRARVIALEPFRGELLSAIAAGAPTTAHKHHA